MRKNICILILLCLAKVSAFSQSPNLAKLYSSIKNPAEKVNVFDSIYVLLNHFDSVPASNPEEEKLYLNVYKAMSAGYATNLHFRQSIPFFQKYLKLKETIAIREKSQAIADGRREFDKKQKADEDEILNLQSQLIQLKTDNDSLMSKRLTFKRIFSFCIFVLTVLFAFLLLRSGIKLKSIKDNLRANQERMKTNHRLAVVGNLMDGIRLTIAANISTIQGNLSEIVSLINKTEGMEKMKSVTSKLDEINALSSETLKNFKT